MSITVFTIGLGFGKKLRNIYILMFIAALFTIAKMWKQRKCQLTDEWASKIRHAHTMEMSRFWKIALLPHSLICSFNGYFFI